jgi:hypothetical protein
VPPLRFVSVIVGSISHERLRRLSGDMPQMKYLDEALGFEHPIINEDRAVQ